MTTSTNNQVVLDFSRVSGLARKVLVKNILSILKLLGYGWPANDAPIFELDVTRLVINMAGTKRNAVGWDNRPFPSYDVPTTIYDVGTHYDEFITAARELALVKYEREGVTVYVTPLGVGVDASELMRRVVEEAQRIQEDTFG